ncbi:hypothetical protein GX51_07176 [Blastomyces parvus]|uniref:DUF7514 domain-containing protein n=1 Tax=Blastomyces parvus TaxID=2060905 RepID=A0A2B7WM86_9EURO|nr:hypothetical protein GX51_07176 [Blastomyces parvus]
MSNTLFYYVADVSGPCNEPPTRLNRHSFQLDPPGYNIYQSDISQNAATPQGDHLPSTGPDRPHTSPILSETSDDTRRRFPPEHVQYESVFHGPPSEPKIWSLLFQKNGNPTLTMVRSLVHPRFCLKNLQRGVVNGIPYLGEVGDITGKHSQLSCLYSELRMEHYLVQARVNEVPTIPALTLLGLQRWMMLLIHAYPVYEYLRLFDIVRSELEEVWSREESPEIPFPVPVDNRAKRTLERAFNEHLGPTYGSAPADMETVSQLHKVAHEDYCVNMPMSSHQHGYGTDRSHHIAYTEQCQSHTSVSSTGRHEDTPATVEEDSMDNNNSLPDSEGGRSSKTQYHEDLQGDGSNSCGTPFPSGQPPAFPGLFKSTCPHMDLSYLHPVTFDPCDSATYDAFYNEGRSRDGYREETPGSDGDTRMGGDYDGDDEASQGKEEYSS